MHGLRSFSKIRSQNKYTYNDSKENGPSAKLKYEILSAFFTNSSLANVSLSNLEKIPKI